MEKWQQYLFLFIFILLPALQWLFKKLYKLTQGAETAAASLQRSRAARRAEEDEEDEGWIHSVDMEREPEPHGGAFQSARVPAQSISTRERATPTAVATPVPSRPRARTPQQEIASFLEQLAGPSPPRRVRPEPERPPIRPAPTPQTRPVEPGPPAQASSPLLVPSAPIQGRSKQRRASREAADSLARDRKTLRNRIVWSEIFAPPIALREEPPGSA